MSYNNGKKNLFLGILLTILIYIIYVLTFQFSTNLITIKSDNEIKNNYEIAKNLYDKKNYEDSLKYIFPIIVTKDDSYSIKAITLLAKMYENGYGFDENIIKAKKLYQESTTSSLNINPSLINFDSIDYEYFDRLLVLILLFLWIIHNRNNRIFVLVATPFALLIQNPILEFNILHQELIDYYYFNSYLRYLILLLLILINPRDFYKIILKLISFAEAKGMFLGIKKEDNISTILIQGTSRIYKTSNLTFYDNFNNMILTESDILEMEKKSLISTVKIAIKKGCDLNLKSEEGLNALGVALVYNNFEIVKLLIENGADVNEQLIIKSNKKEFDKLSEDNTIDFLPFEEYCEVYPIEIAVVYWNADNIKLFLENGAKLVDNNIYNLFSGARVNNGLSTIQFICAIGDENLIKYLISNGYEDSIDDLLQDAVSRGDYEVSNILLTHRDNNLPLTTYLGDLIIDKNIELLKLFVKHNVILDERKCNELNQKFKNMLSYLMLCINNKDKIDDEVTYYEIAKYLIENGVDVNYKNPLIHTLKHKVKMIDNSYNQMDYKLFYLLTNNGADVNYIDKNTGETILMAACKASFFMDKNDSLKINSSGNRDIKYLIENGAVIENFKDIKLNMIKYIVDMCVDINIKDNKGNCALMILINTKYEHIVLKNVTDGYIDFSFDNKDLWKKYFYKEPVNTQIIKLLVEHSADINTKNNMGITPLMHYASKGEDKLVEVLIEHGADINVKSEITAFDLAANDEIKKLIKSTTNHTPQKLVKLLTNFTIDKPIKYTTHTWDFGSLDKSDYKNFYGYMSAVKSQFAIMQNELESLSPNLYKKVYTFLLETNPDENYSWCSKGDINIGWSSLDGLKEYCDSGKIPFDFRLKKAIALSDGTRIRKFGDVIDLFKQEIEVRRDFKTLEKIFNTIGKGLPDDFILSTSKLEKQFYTDVSQFTSALNKIFEPIKKSSEFKNIDVDISMPQSEYFELRITHIGSPSTLNSKELLNEIESGDFADIKTNLTNLCDWSVEGIYEDENFRINYLKSNNVKDIEKLENKPKGFTHILRFYK